MKLWSEAWINGEAIPDRFCAGRIGPDGRPAPGDNLSPPLAWSDLPPGTASLVLVAHDFDAPSPQAVAAAGAAELPAELPRADFFHWVLVDLPPSVQRLDEGAFSRGFTAGGKPGPGAPQGARQGLNDFSAWFEGDAALRGRYHGYDGPWPPANDSLVHHYVFTLYALSVPTLPVEGSFTGGQVREALAGRVLGAATLSGTCTLNPRLRC